MINDEHQNMFEIDYDNINVEEIMKKIRENIQKRGIQQVDFPDLNSVKTESNGFSINSLEENVKKCNTQWDVITETPIYSHRKVIGKAIVFAKKVIRKAIGWYVKYPFASQREFNANMVRTINCMEQFIKETDSKLSKIPKDINFIEIEEMIKNIEKTYSADFSERILRVEENIRALNGKSAQIEDMNVVLSQRLKRLQSEKIKHSSELSTSNDCIKKVEANEEQFDIDYLTFENLYRGSREEIKRRQTIYLGHLEGIDNIIDIGCGRGELLELLKENGKTNVNGIDINEDMVAFCKEKGLPVECDDGINYLDSIENNSLGGVILSQVVEHLTASDIIRIVRIAYEKLKKDGVLIIETVNPQCLSVFANSFYLDLSHNNPVHPLTMKFIIDGEGFANAKIIYQSEILEKFPQIKADCIDNIEEVNLAIDRLNKLLYGPQDYAIIAKK